MITRNWEGIFAHRWSKTFMPHRRGIATDQLTNILQVIQLGRKTGLLTVERGEGAQREEGEITFQQGYVMHAHSGQLEGMTALNWMKTWGPCRFIFVNSNDERSTGPIQELSPMRTTGSLPTVRNTTRDVPLTPTPRVAHTPPLGNYMQRPYPNEVLNETLFEGLNKALSAGTESSNTQTSSVRRLPHRTGPAHEGLKRLEVANLSRQHRQCYLLIDGHRTLFELAKLMGREPKDVILLLQELTHINVVQY
jgi:hypothetical protein